MTNLPINSLQFDEIRDNFVSYLRDQKDQQGVPIYQDYDFDASGISTLLNLLAYNSHFLGYYVKMLLNESFVDSATQLKSLYSLAKLNGYVPKSAKSASASVMLSVDVDVGSQPTAQSILVPRGTVFSSSNATQDSRRFYTVDDIYVNNIAIDGGTATYTSEYFLIYEGTFREYQFQTDTTLLNQRYVIEDESIDVDSIEVKVQPEGSGSQITYVLGSNLFEVQSTDNVFYLGTNYQGYYEIIFGNGVFGTAPANNSIVTVTYIRSNGDSGNGAKVFVFNAPTVSVPIENSIGNWEDFTVVLEDDEPSTGGMDPETVEDLRYSIPYHSRRQQRIVTEDDYRSLILSEYRNIDSLNVWGGERNGVKTYGTIFLAIKPKYADKLTATAKADISRNLIEKYAVVGTEPVFVDPEFINVEVEAKAKVDQSRTTKSLGQVQRDITQAILDYNSEFLNRFGNLLSDVQMLSSVTDAYPEVTTIFSSKKLDKDFTFLYASGIENSVHFGNAFVTGVVSTHFLYGGVECEFRDATDGYLYIHRVDTGAKFVQTPQGSVDYDSGIVKFTFPIFATMIDSDFGNSGIINFTVTPRDPDILTTQQNIVRITTVRVLIEAA